MRSFTSSIGVFAIAVALGVVTNKDEPQAEDSGLPEKAKARKVVSHIRSDHSALRSRRPALSDVESLAYSRLDELTETLFLDRDQIEKLRPLILRATPGYLPENRYASFQPNASANSPLGPPLLRSHFEDQLFALLDGEQQLDYAASVAEREVWWSNIIARLEADLENHTSPEEDLPASSGPTSHGRRNLSESD
ncbi:hypothetical protein OAF84_01485 [Akkermansiaceae bacterium]|nr:hypothetical protein [Verrucomicrobiaceae bacterium]MDB4753934.1 hypothetical protein [Akkermansiaceae bacterium]